MLILMHNSSKQDEESAFMLAAHLFINLNANINPNPISQDFVRLWWVDHNALEESFAHFKVKSINLVQSERTFTKLFQYHDHK